MIEGAAAFTVVEAVGVDAGPAGGPLVGGRPGSDGVRPRNQGAGQDGGGLACPLVPREGRVSVPASAEAEAGLPGEGEVQVPVKRGDVGEAAQEPGGAVAADPVVAGHGAGASGDGAGQAHL